MENSPCDKSHRKTVPGFPQEDERALDQSEVNFWATDMEPAGMGAGEMERTGGELLVGMALGFITFRAAVASAAVGGVQVSFPFFRAISRALIKISSLVLAMSRIFQSG